MFAPLLSLLLAASPAERCGAIWSGIEQGKDYRQDILGNLLHNQADAATRLRARFLERCAELPEKELACGEAHGGRGLLRSCEGLGRIFHEAVTSPEVAGTGELATLRAEGMAREVWVHLRELGQAARALRNSAKDRAHFHFPESVGPTPKGDCCATAGHTCAADPALWDEPTWKALQFAPREATRFRYSFESKGEGKEASFVAKAEGDPDCSGHTEVFEVTGELQGNKFVVSDVKRR